MRTSLFLSLLLLLFSTAASAQTRIDAGVSIGQQAYESSQDDPRVLTSAEVLFSRGALGAQLAVEYADLSTVDGPLVAAHTDFVYRHRFGGVFSLAAGAGPTFISVGSTLSEWTWNAEAEAAWSFGRTGVFARVRQYSFDIAEFRAGPAGPDRPAVYVGARFALRR